MTDQGTDALLSAAVRAHADARNVPFPGKKDEREVAAVLQAIAAAGFALVDRQDFEWAEQDVVSGELWMVGRPEADVREACRRRDDVRPVHRYRAGPWRGDGE